ncbi:DUF1573 domain-containing protein [Ancylomarina longa]|uniref:DUF1573 domain-containing protein n=1 Tax=Ancylomarina longa TaxID=2487017 RepID=A0A434AXG6_9BACT|nr:DUF1573 domain-containing protein [Ancylomarina longa]RUT79222.1 DUF1573 domain-containing protein [Ancylomarina longa]
MNSLKHHSKIYFTLFLIISYSTLLGACGNNSEKGISTQSNKNRNPEIAKSYPKFEFTEEIHKFGVISEGEIAVCEFYYKNTGQADLIISNIETSCGCTAVDWDKYPLKQGEEAKLSVQFDSKGRSGIQYKAITIFCNTIEGTKELIITAQVE